MEHGTLFPDCLITIRRLEDCGIDGAVAMVWPLGEERYATVDGKLEAMQAFANRYVKG